MINKKLVMKKIGIIAGVLFVILLIASGCHYARHQRKEMKEYAAMHFMRNGNGSWHRRGMWDMRGRIAGGMRGDMMNNMRPGMGRGQGMGPRMRMGRGMGQMPDDSTGIMPFAPGRRILESIPNVTDDQKKQIEQLMKKNQEEMKKIGEEFSSKMQATRESHRKEMLDILTPEQKKYFESEQGKPF
jgi:hypothetical protein